MVGAAAPPTGTLRLRVERAGSGRSIAAEQFHAGALRVLRPHYPDGSGQAVFTMVNPGGGFLGNDSYEVEYDGGAGSSVLLTTQSATKVYRTPQGPARQAQRFRLAPGARLEYVPDQLIAYADAEYAQVTDVELAAGASYLAAEIVTPGWSPRGEAFRYREVRLLTRVYLAGKLLLWDNLVLRPDAANPGGLGMLDGHSHCASLVAVHPGMGREQLELVRAAAAQVPDVQVGCSLLEGPGLVLRALGDSSGQLAGLVAAVGSCLRAVQTGQGPWDLRKY